MAGGASELWRLTGIRSGRASFSWSVQAESWTEPGASSPPKRKEVDGRSGLCCPQCGCVARSVIGSSAFVVYACTLHVWCDAHKYCTLQPCCLVHVACTLHTVCRARNTYTELCTLCAIRRAHAACTCSLHAVHVLLSGARDLHHVHLLSCKRSLLRAHHLS